MKQKGISTSTDPGPFSFKMAFGLAFFASLLVTLVVFFNIVLRLDIFHWDESHHAVYGLWVSQALRAFDWSGFWYWTNHQAYWPFFHSWLLAIFFLFFGVSATSARGLSVLIFFVTAVLTYLAGSKILDKKDWRPGLLATALVLTSPLMISFAAQNMLEGLGGVELIAAVYAYLIAKEKKQWYWFLLLGGLLGLTVITKYNYAVLIIASFVVVDLLDIFELPRVAGQAKAIAKPKSKHQLVKTVPTFLGFEKAPLLDWLRQTGVTALPILLITLLWFFGADAERKWQMLLWTKSEVAGGQATLSGFWQNLLFYPQAIVNDFVLSYWLGLLVLLANLWLLLGLKCRRILKLQAIVWTTLLLSIFVIGNKMNRNIYFLAPAIFMIFSASFFYYFDLARAKLKNYRLLFLLLLLGLLVLAGLAWPRAVKMYSGDIQDIKHGLHVNRETKERVADSLRFFRDNIPQTGSISAGSLYYVSPYVLYIYFRNWQAPVLTAFQMSDPNFAKSDFFIALEYQDTQRFEAPMLEWLAVLRKNEAAQQLQLWRQKSWPDLGLTAKIYIKPNLNLLGR